MKKKELVDKIMEALPEHKSAKAQVLQGYRATRMQTEMILETFWEVAAAELLGGGEVTMPGIGRLKTTETKGREGRHPQTGEPLAIPPGRRISVTLFKDFKEALKP